METLSARVRFWYGAGEGGITVTWTAFYGFYLYFLTDFVGVDPTLAGALVLLGTGVSAVLLPLIGIYSDNRTAASGRRRPLMLAAIPPYLVTAWLMFTHFGFGRAGTLVYFAVMVIAYWFFNTLYYAPYQALLPELSADYDERTALATWRTAWSAVGTLVGSAAVLVLVDTMSSWLGDRSQLWGWSLMGLILGVVAVGPMSATWWTARGRELHPEKASVRLRDMLGAFAHNRTFRYTAAIFTLAFVAQTIIINTLIYFMAWNLGWSEARTSVAFLVIGVLGIVGALVAGAVMGRLGKKLTLCLFYGALAAALALLAPFAGPSPNGQLLFWIVAVVGALCWPAGSIAIWAMVPDCVEVDEFATGERREGLYSGVATFLQSAGVAVAAQLVGLTLGLAGYVETADAQPASALAAIKLTLAWAPSTLMLITIALTVKLPMTRARHQALRTAINCRRRGESFDEEPLRELL